MLGRLMIASGCSFGLRLSVLGPLENADLIGLDLTLTEGKPTGFEDVFTKIAATRAHYARIGCEAGPLEGIIR
jgi:hypothetical protein